MDANSYLNARLGDLERSQSRLIQEINRLKQDSHPPVDIAPRIYDELDRMATLGRLFYDVPTNQLEQAAQLGLNSFNSTLAQDIRR